MKIANCILDCIGNTPIIKLSRFNTDLPFNLYVKCEMFNPTLSIKDRIVLTMIRSMEKNGMLKPGMTIIEASSGNTGTSLAMISTLLGYKSIITVPAKTSDEKINTMRIFGAQVLVSPPHAKEGSSNHYMKRAEILSRKLKNIVLLGQYESQINVETHQNQTASEIWDQMDGKIDYLVSTASSGGTITGIGTFLKGRNQNIKIIMPDPIGSIFYDYFHHPHLIPRSTVYEIEGAGKDKVCSIHDFSLIDDVIQFSDEQAFATVEKMARTEGILVGGSAAGALFVAENLKYYQNNAIWNKNVLVILPDSGFKYLSKYANVGLAKA